MVTPTSWDDGVSKNPKPPDRIRYEVKVLEPANYEGVVVKVLRRDTETGQTWVLRVQKGKESARWERVDAWETFEPTVRVPMKRTVGVTDQQYGRMLRAREVVTKAMDALNELEI